MDSTATPQAATTLQNDGDVPDMALHRNGDVPDMELVDGSLITDTEAHTAQGQDHKLTLQIKALKAANKEAVSKVDMLEDMDSQLRHQLEKMIHQRNQCSAEKAQRDLEIEHLQAQVYLLEADVTGRHQGLDSPRTPSRDPEEVAELLHQQIEHLHSENMRLHSEVEAATANLAEHEQHSAQAQHPAATRTNDGQQVLQLKLQQLEESAASAQQREDALHTQLQEQQRTLMATNATVVELEGKIALHKDSLAAAAAKHVAATKLGLSKGVQHAHCQTTEEQQQGQVLDHKSEPVQTDPQHFPSTAPYGSEQHVGHQTDAMSDSEVDPLQDTPFSKTQSSPASTLDASPHLQEQLACQKQLTKELTDTVAKLTAQLAQNTPDTPSPGHLRGHPTATPVTSPTGDATPDSSPASSREYSSQADSADAAQPIKLLTKFQQSDDEAAGESHGQATMVKNQGHASEAVDSAVSRIGSADDDTQVESDSVAASQVSSPLQLSPPESAPSSPSVTRAPGSSAEQTQGNGFRPVMHVNDSFDASDEEGLPSPAAPQSRVHQAQADSDVANSQTQLLQRQVQQQQQLLRSLLQRAEAAEHGLKQMQTALTQAQETAASLQQRNNRIELANVMTSCVAAFLAASAGTMYLLH